MPVPFIPTCGDVVSQTQAWQQPCQNLRNRPFLSQRKGAFMPRPTKCRKVCHFPQVLEFLPSQAGEQKAPVILTVDEYEAIRLIDKEGLSQEQCCEFMQIARTTVQRIYESARKKLAAVLVDGLALRIEGGDFWLCDGRATHCGQDG